MRGTAFRIRVFLLLDTQIEDKGQYAVESYDYQGDKLDRGKKRARYYYNKGDEGNLTNTLGRGGRR